MTQGSNPTLQIKRFAPLPAPGDFVWCRFPETLGVPGPKNRPALVIGVADDDHRVRVCYGTTKKTDTLYPGEFVIDPDDDGFALSGLAARTKFDLGNCVDLPFNSRWFVRHESLAVQVPLPKMGTLHSCYTLAIQEALALIK